MGYPWIKPGGNREDLRCEEIFVNGYTRLKHVGSYDELGPGKWYFDYDADRIYLYDDPASFKLIETSTETAAFYGDGTNPYVTIENLVIEKYASHNQFGAIGGFGIEGQVDGRYYNRWTIRHCDIGYNHGGGIAVGQGSTVENCKIHHNGQEGMDNITPPVGYYTGYITIRNNEIYENLVLDFNWEMSGGGVKFCGSQAGMLFENNWVHDNKGPGAWWDGYVRDTTIRSNLSLKPLRREAIPVITIRTVSIRMQINGTGVVKS